MNEFLSLEEPFSPDPEESPEPEALKDIAQGAFTHRIRFTWRPEDQAILDRIETTANEMFAEMFGEAVTEIDRFYETLRTPRVRNGQPVRDVNGRTIWEADENGRPQERWEQLTGQDIEYTLMNLERIKMLLTLEVNKMRNRAIFAKMVSEDIKDDSRGSGGTQLDKVARSNIESRVDRYHAYFVYCLWSTANVFMQDITLFMKRLADIRYWRIQDQR